MIGVLANLSEHDVAREFFELFKTPWEFARAAQHYDVLLIAGDHELIATAELTVVYSSKKTAFDETHQIDAALQQAQHFLKSKADRLPIYGDAATFGNQQEAILTVEHSGECCGHVQRNGSQRLARFGYDLFHEVRTLLAIGQPVANAGIPTLELHITLLRELIIEFGISLVEIPPVPEGYSFIACLTHDVDHPSLRQHKWDHTAMGFIHRATVGSLVKLLRGQISLRALFENWLAAAKLPLVYLGLAKDFWSDFADRYRALEQEFRSTFFFIPYKNHPGAAVSGSAPSFRASGYGAKDIADVISGLAADGLEIGLHGIDAWVDTTKARDELRELESVAGKAPVGVRMHWLYFDQGSPKKLEEAGAQYDSTCGYNDAVGYRAGTTQVFKPLSTTHLLELPLHVMDTALFYPSRMELSPAQAAPVIDQILANAVRFGGVVTVNWHDRSLAPERLWGAPYRDLLASMKARGVWFATAGETVTWFRNRRAASFETDPSNPDSVLITLSFAQKNAFPRLKLQAHKQNPAPTENSSPSSAHQGAEVKGSTEFGVPPAIRP